MAQHANKGEGMGSKFGCEFERISQQNEYLDNQILEEGS